MKSQLGEIQQLRPSDPGYPQRVLEVPGRARILRLMGDPDVLEQGPVLAIVGTREPTPEIERDTRRVVEVAAEFEMVILSGLSPGVDAIAHGSAIERGLRTVAVPGCGLESLFDSDRAELAERIVEAGGLIVSPYPNESPETPDRRWWRNRLIAGFCHGFMLVASESEGGAWEAYRWARQLERRIIEPAEMTD
jgi:DNA processing protein